MKLRVCFKDHYPCRAETCGEYDVCKVRLEKEKKTNEEWFCQLSTEEKADFFHGIVIRVAQATWDGKKPDYPAYLYDWKKWLKEEHKE